MRRPKSTFSLPAARIHRRSSGTKKTSRVDEFFFGAGLVVFGIVAWGWRQGAEWAESPLEWWPMALVWIGLGKLLSRQFAPAVGLILGGGLTQLHLLGIADLEYTWPLILVAVGLAVTAGALLGNEPEAEDDADVSMSEELEGEVEVADEIRAEEVRNG